MPTPTRIKAVVPTRPTPSPERKAPRLPDQIETPLIAQIMQVIAAVNLFLGFIVAILYFSEAYPMSSVIGLSCLIGALLTSVCLYAFACLLTWVYNIMLNTRRK